MSYSINNNLFFAHWSLSSLPPTMSLDSSLINYGADEISIETLKVASAREAIIAESQPQSVGSPAASCVIT